MPHALGELTANWGCFLESAQDEEAALEYARTNHAPNVLLVDYQLGEGMDGLQLAQTLREIWGEVPVCIVSAAPDESWLDSLGTYGFDFLRKPVKPSRLRALLERYAERERDSIKAVTK